MTETFGDRVLRITYDHDIGVSEAEEIGRTEILIESRTQCPTE